jgi:hypothetical protein
MKRKVDPKLFNNYGILSANHKVEKQALITYSGV